MYSSIRPIKTTPTPPNTPIRAKPRTPDEANSIRTAPVAAVEQVSQALMRTTQNQVIPLVASENHLNDRALHPRNLSEAFDQTQNHASNAPNIFTRASENLVEVAMSLNTTTEIDYLSHSFALNRQFFRANNEQTEYMIADSLIDLASEVMLSPEESEPMPIIATLATQIIARSNNLGERISYLRDYLALNPQHDALSLLMQAKEKTLQNELNALGKFSKALVAVKESLGATKP